VGGGGGGGGGVKSPMAITLRAIAKGVICAMMAAT